MNELTARKCLTLMFADHGAELNDAKVELWANLFSHIPDATAIAATKWLLLQGSYGLPKASDFSAAVARVERGTSLPEPLEAWTLALTSKNDCPAIVKKVLQAFPEDFGILALNSMATVRGQFIKLYQGELNRHLENVGASPELKSEVKRIRDEHKRQLSHGEQKAVALVKAKELAPTQAPHIDKATADKYEALTGERLTKQEDFYQRANSLSNNAWVKETNQ